MSPRALAGACGIAAALLTGTAQAQVDCRLGEAQQLLDQQPPRAAQAEALLAGCPPGDWRVDWLQGLAARAQRRLDEALALLTRAHRQAPTEPAPLLDLAVVYEWRSEPARAAALYAQLLRADPASRPALLGSARVALARGRNTEARAIHEGLLRRDPGDVEAALGLAQADLADRRLDDARRRFEAVLVTQPGNAEALRGLEQVGQAWRYQFDVAIGGYDFSAGSGNSASLGLRIDLNAREQVELGLGRNSRELPSARIADATPLPSWVARTGYRALTPQGWSWSAAYEYRERKSDPAEHRVELGLGAALTDGVRWFAGFRQGFGASRWNNRLAHAGLSMEVARHWSVAGTLYAGHEKLSGSTRAVALDLYRDTGPLGMLFNVGVGHSPDPDNTSVHARLIYPIAPLQAIVLSLERRTLGREVEAQVGWRVYLR